MIPIRKGDGTGLSVPGVSQVRTGDGRVLFDAEPAIPDSVVSRPFDTQNNSYGSRANGIEIEARVQWEKWQFEVSSMSSGWNGASLHEAGTNNELWSISQSLTAGDIVTVDYQLDAGTKYWLRKSNTGTYGYTEASYPYVDDGGGDELAITNGVAKEGDGTRSDFVFSFSRVGNIDGSL